MTTESGRARASANQRPVSLWQDFSDLRKKRLERIGKAAPAVEKMKAIGTVERRGGIPFYFLTPCGPINTWPCVPRSTPKAFFLPKNWNFCWLLSTPLTYTVMARARGAAFKAGATVEEIMEVLKLGVVQGVQACNLGVTLLTEELERDAAAQAKSRKTAIFSL
jgi:hypothetical protein